MGVSTQATSELCANQCGEDSRCAYWSYDFISATCTLYDSAEKACATSYGPSNLNPEDCSGVDKHNRLGK